MSLPFSQWWYNIGSGMPPKEGEDLETFAKRVCGEAFKAGEAVNKTILEELTRGDRVILPKTLEHARNMYRVAFSSLQSLDKP